MRPEMLGRRCVFTFSLLALLICVGTVPTVIQAQPSFEEHGISPEEHPVRYLYASDVDGDGQPDVLTAAGFGPYSPMDPDRAAGSIGWYENRLREAGPDERGFSEKRVITTNVADPQVVLAVDLNGDGKPDVVSASSYDDTIAWYENQIDGANGHEDGFGEQRVISKSVENVVDIEAADLDGDGDVDLVAGGGGDIYDGEGRTDSMPRLVWFENQGDGTFGESNAIMEPSPEIMDIHVRDLDRDQDADVLIATSGNEDAGDPGEGTPPKQGVSWFSNKIQEAGSDDGGFGERRNIMDEADLVWNLGTLYSFPSVATFDLDDDGDLEVIHDRASYNASLDAQYWHENKLPEEQPGSGFGPPRGSTAGAPEIVEKPFLGRMSISRDTAAAKGAWDGTIFARLVEAGALSEDNGRRPGLSTAQIYAEDLDGDGFIDVVAS